MKHDRFVLSLPAKAEYMLTVRMLVSSIASRLDFSFDTIEDIKAGASEACILLMSALPAPQSLQLEVTAADRFFLAITAEGEKTASAKAEPGSGDLAKCLIDEFFDRAKYIYEEKTLKRIELEKQP